MTCYFEWNDNNSKIPNHWFFFPSQNINHTYWKCGKCRIGWRWKQKWLSFNSWGTMAFCYGSFSGSSPHQSLPVSSFFSIVFPLFTFVSLTASDFIGLWSVIPEQGLSLLPSKTATPLGKTRGRLGIGREASRAFRGEHAAAPTEVQGRPCNGEEHMTSERHLLPLPHSCAATWRFLALLF